MYFFKSFEFSLRIVNGILIEHIPSRTCFRLSGFGWQVLDAWLTVAMRSLASITAGVALLQAVGSVFAKAGDLPLCPGFPFKPLGAFSNQIEMNTSGLILLASWNGHKVVCHFFI